MAAAGVCTNWLSLSQCAVFLPKFKLFFIGSTLDSDKEPFSVYLKNTMFNYSAVVFDEACLYRSDVMAEFCLLHGDSLQRIALQHTQIEHVTLYEMLRNLPQLTHLELESTRFVYGDFAATTAFAKLRLNNCTHLTLKDMYCMSDSQLKMFITMMPHLTSLSLNGTKLSCHPGLYGKFYPDPDTPLSPFVLTIKHILEFICGPVADHLTHLDFSYTKLDDNALIKISERMRLIGISLAQCTEISNKSLLKMFQLQPQLRELNLSRMWHINNHVVMEICQQLSDMRVLRLAGSKTLTNDGMEPLRLLRRLRVLDISNGTFLTCLALQSLSRQLNACLHELYMRECRFDGVIEPLFRNCPNLRVLDASNNRSWEPVALNWITEHLQGLQVLLITHCQVFAEPDDDDDDNGDDGAEPGLAVPFPMNRLRGLRTLDITGCPRVTDSLLTNGLRLPELNRLTMARLKEITERGLEQLVRNCPAIRHLDLSRCPNVDDKSIGHVARGLQRLTHLHVMRCRRLSNDSLFLLEEHAKRLRVLHMEGCHRLRNVENIINMPSVRLHFDIHDDMDYKPLFWPPLPVPPPPPPPPLPLQPEPVQPEPAQPEPVQPEPAQPGLEPPQPPPQA